MRFAHHDLDEAHVRFVLIVGEGAQDVVAVAQHMQFARHGGQKRALQRDGDDDDAEDDAEQIVRQAPLAQLRDGVDGEHDGRHPAQPRPGDDAHLIGAGAEGKQQRRHRRGAGDDGHEHEDEQRRHQHLGADEPLGRSQKAEQEKDHHLGDGGDGVEKADAVPLLGDAGVAQHDAADVHGEVPVARPKPRQHRGHGVADKGDGEHEDGAPLPHVEGDGLEDVDRQKPERRPERRPDAHLRAQHARDLPRAHGGGALDAVLRRQYGGEHHGEHVRGGVVGAGLHFQ